MNVLGHYFFGVKLDVGLSAFSELMLLFVLSSFVVGIGIALSYFLCSAEGIYLGFEYWRSPNLTPLFCDNEEQPKGGNYVKINGFGKKKMHIYIYI